jgi:hypothetical protein
MELFFEQLTPLVILSQTAEETGKSVEQVQDETNKSLENPATQEAPQDQSTSDAILESEPQPNVSFVRTSQAFFNKEYETYND